MSSSSIVRRPGFGRMPDSDSARPAPAGCFGVQPEYHVVHQGQT